MDGYSRSLRIRDIHLTAQAVADEARLDHGDPIVLSERLQQLLTALAHDTSTGSAVPTMAELIPDAIERLEQRHQSKGKLRGIGSGLGLLDKLTGGWQGGQMIVVTAREKEGKSSLARQFILEAAVTREVPMASQLHPGYRLAGELLPQGPMALRSVGNLAQIGGIAADALGEGATTASKAVAASTAVDKQLAQGAAGGAAAEGVLRPAVNYTLNKAADVAGIQHGEANGVAPSVAFQALTRLKAKGATITPEFARDVAGKVGAIMDDPQADRQAALKQLVKDHLPTQTPAAGAAKLGEKVAR